MWSSGFVSLTRYACLDFRVRRLTALLFQGPAWSLLAVRNTDFEPDSESRQFAGYVFQSKFDACGRSKTIHTDAWFPAHRPTLSTSGLDDLIRLKDSVWFSKRNLPHFELLYFELNWCWFVMYWLHRPERYSHTTLMQLRGGDTEAEGLKRTGHQVLCATKDATKGLSWKIQVHGTFTFIWRFKETHVFFVLGITWKDSFWHLQWITWGATFGSSSIVGSALGPLLWRRETQPDMGRTAMWICPTGQGMVDDGRWHFWRSSCS